MLNIFVLINILDDMGYRLIIGDQLMSQLLSIPKMAKIERITSLHKFRSGLLLRHGYERGIFCK
jgi:hypothetical protein